MVSSSNSSYGNSLKTLYRLSRRSRTLIPRSIEIYLVWHYCCDYRFAVRLARHVFRPLFRPCRFRILFFTYARIYRSNTGSTVHRIRRGFFDFFLYTKTIDLSEQQQQQQQQWSPVNVVAVFSSITVVRLRLPPHGPPSHLRFISR